ncbi:type II secretion system F family protein [Robbsia sp. Bb-Pol-6]|uniref:Type II secretion system F family protein n=1 Tax=Robbsia betulipollinis TaxID=2981849 RepID=A0ABT3ZMR3_9BURK|nr:type II secretion system F family protein [Robbsia betulipollinis]MCY0387854.1 type II secretion system F family protein [Robbsia betulipollinis]
MLMQRLRAIRARAAVLPRGAAYRGLRAAVRRFHKRRAKFYGDFADALEDGANPFDLFSRKHARAVQRKDPMAPLYALWRDRTGAGSLRKAWHGTVPDDDLMIVAAGEKADLPAALRFLAKVIAIRARNRTAVMLAVALPVFLFVLMMGVQIGVALGMMPIMVQIIAVEHMPPVGRALHDVSLFVARYWTVVYGAPALLALAFFHSLPRWTGRLRAKLDRFPPYSIYRDLRSSEFLVSLAALTAANTSTYDAVALLSANASPWLRQHLARMRLSLRSSRSMLLAMDTGLFSDEIFDRVIEYAERSNFEQGLRKIGMTTIEELAETLSRRSVVLRNVLLVGVGGFILFTVMGMLQIGQEASNRMQALM